MSPAYKQIALNTHFSRSDKSQSARKCTDSPATLTVKVLEVDSSHLIEASNGNYYNIWPSELPRIDGVFVCYDASDAKSLAHIGELLSTFY